MKRTCRQCGVNLSSGSNATYRDGGAWFECFPCAIEDPGYRARITAQALPGQVYAR